MPLENPHLETTTQRFQNEHLETDTYMSIADSKQKLLICDQRGRGSLRSLLPAAQHELPEAPAAGVSLTSAEAPPPTSSNDNQITADDWRRIDDRLRRAHGVGPIKISQAMKRVLKAYGVKSPTSAMKGVARIDALARASGMGPREASDEFERLALQASQTDQEDGDGEGREQGHG